MGHENDHAGYKALRVRALESLLVEKGLLGSDAIDRIVAAYEEDIGPLNGACAVARAWVDPAFRARLLEDATPALRELGIGGVEGEHMVALENTPSVEQRRRVHAVLVLPVTLVEMPRPSADFKSQDAQSQTGPPTKVRFRLPVTATSYAQPAKCPQSNVSRSTSLTRATT
jgi:nitrile hydratase